MVIISLTTVLKLKLRWMLTVTVLLVRLSIKVRILIKNRILIKTRPLVKIAIVAVPVQQVAGGVKGGNRNSQSPSTGEVVVATARVDSPSITTPVVIVIIDNKNLSMLVALVAARTNNKSPSIIIKIRGSCKGEATVDQGKVPNPGD